MIYLWRTLNKEEPLINEDVLVFTTGNQYCIWTFINNKNYYCTWEDEYGFFQEKDDVKAWMPIPAYKGK